MRTLHSIAGLFSGVFILLMSLSGSLLVFHDELDSLQRPGINISSDKNFITVDSAYNIIKKQYPKAQISHCVLPDTKYPGFRFTIYDSLHNNAVSPLQVFIHPQSGAIAGSRDGKSFNNSFMNWLSTFHNSFHLHKKGEWLLGFFGLIFLISLLTGLILYRKSILAVLAFRKRVYKWSNLHQLVGVYALLFNLMIGITGVWMQRYVFKKEFYSGNGWKSVVKTTPVLSYNIDSAYHALQKQHPDFTLSTIYFAQRVNGSTTLYGSRSRNSFIHSKKLADYVSLDSTGAVAYTGFVTDIKSSDRYDIINAQVHFGQYGGWPVKLIYCLLGLASGLLGITGFLMWMRKNTK